MKIQAALFTLLFLVASIPVRAAGEPDEFKQLKARFEAQKEKDDAPLKSLNESYVGALQRLLEKESQSGELNRVVTVKKEIEQFSGGENFTKTAFEKRFSEDRNLRDLQEKYLRARVSVDTDLRKVHIRLLDIYINQLEALEQKFTRDLKIEDALLIKQERDLVTKRLDILKARDFIPAQPQEMRLHIVAKGENEVYLNGREIRYRNSWKEERPDREPENDYTDATSTPVEVGVGDIVVLKLRGEAVFRGCAIGFVSADEKKHVIFPAKSFRLIETGDRLNAKSVDATEFAKKAAVMVPASQADGEMSKLWRRHNIVGSEFVQPPDKTQWALLAAVINESMFVDASESKQ